MDRSRHINLICPKSILFILIVFIYIGVTNSMSEENNYSKGSMSIDNFLELAEKGEIEKIETYYYNWHSLVRAAITEKYLMETFCNYRVTSNDPDVSALIEALKKFKFEKANNKSFDLRIGFVFYGDKHDVLRIFIAKNSNSIVVNGNPYKMSPDILKSLVQYLPVQAYFDIYEDMKKNRTIELPLPTGKLKVSGIFSD